MTCQRPKLTGGKCGRTAICVDCYPVEWERYPNDVQYHMLSKEGWRHLFAGLAAAAIITRDHAITLKGAALKGIETADALLEELEKK